MKRLTAALMCVMLLFCSTTALGAGVTIFPIGQEGPASMQDLLRFMVYTDGVTYLFTNDTNGFMAVTDDGNLTKYTWEEGTIVSYGDDVLDLNSAVAHEGKLYALCVRMRKNPEEDTQRVRGAFLYEVELDSESHIAKLGDRVKLDWGDMITEQKPDFEMSMTVMYPFIQDGKLVFTTFSGVGRFQPVVFDLDSGDGEMLDIKNYSDIAAYKDGKALVLTWDNLSSPAKYAFSTLDLNTNATNLLIEKQTSDLSHPSSILYDAKTDKLYYRMDSELWVAEGVTTDQAQPLSVVGGFSSNTSRMALTNDGNIIVPNVENVIKCNTDPSARTDKVIRVMERGYITEQSANAFGQTHPDVEVIRDAGGAGVVEAMMNRSSDIDVYCVDVNSSDYSALYNRGFMADLSSSEILAKTVGEMYPAIQAAVTKDQKLLALPIEFYSMVYGYFPKAFNTIGVTSAPKTWVEFFELLSTVPDIMDDNPSIALFDMGLSVTDTRKAMIESVVTSYLLYLGSGQADSVSFDSPVLRDILAAFDKIDFNEMGLTAKADAFTSVDSDEQPLLTPWRVLNVSVPYYDDMPEPLILSLGENIPPLIQASATVMFVNPFSENIDLAIEFVECTAGMLDNLLLANICPDRNEPIETTYGASSIAETEQRIKDFEAALEKADEDSAESIEISIKELKQELELLETRGRYAANAQSIASYREYAGSFRVGLGLGIDITSSPDIVTAIRQYTDGAINADAFIHSIDQRLKMMMLEGM